MVWPPAILSYSLLFGRTGGNCWSTRAAAADAAATTTTALATLVGCCFCYCYGLSRLDCNPSLYVRHALSQQRGLAGLLLHRDALEDKCIWIVGASQGIGAELAYKLCASSNHNSNSTSHRRRTQPLILSSRSVDRLYAVAEKCRRLLSESSASPSSTIMSKDELHRLVRVVPMDVTDSASMRAALQCLADDPNFALDMAVLNAGRGHLSPALETDPTTARDVWEQTAVWPMLLMPLLMPLFRRHSASSSAARPHIAVTSSVAVTVPIPLSAVYTGAKQALRGYFDALQAEHPHLRVDHICPGPVDTGFHRSSQTPPPLSPADDGGSLLSSSHPSSSSSLSSSPMKVSVGRCAELYAETLAWPSRSGGHTVQIGPPPTVLAARMYHACPRWLQRKILRSLAARRLDLHRNGADLYDPRNWRWEW